MMKQLWLLMLCLCSAGALAAGNVYNSATAGFQVTKPHDWQFLDIDDNQRHLENVRLEDEEFRQMMLKRASLPLVAMIKHPEPYHELNPSVRVGLRPFGELAGMNAIELLRLMTPQLEKVFADFSLEQPPVGTVVAGMNAAYMRMNYSLQSTDGDSYPTTSEMWLVPRGDYYFLIGAGTRQDESTGSRAEIAAIVDSIVISRAAAE